MLKMRFEIIIKENRKYYIFTNDSYSTFSWDKRYIISYASWSMHIHKNFSYLKYMLSNYSDIFLID